MATRFGGYSPARVYFTQVRWLIAGMLSLIVVLSLSLFFVALQGEEDGVSDITGPALAMAEVPMKRVLIATQRIEGGEQLVPDMFQTTHLLDDQIGPRTVLANEQAEVWGKYAQHLIPAGQPLASDHLSEHRPFSELLIPSGYRATTITADEREIVEGFVTPSSRVDVIWTYRDRLGVRTVQTLVKAAKVLSVARRIRAHGKVNVQKNNNTVTLLVSKRQAHMIELARSNGNLSLSLLGRIEPIGEDQDDAGTITLAQMMNRNKADQPAIEPVYDGTMITVDESGRPVRYLLAGRSWQRDRKF